MKLRIKSGKTNFKLWLPSGTLTISLLLRVAKIDNKRLSKDVRRKLIAAFNETRKYHKPLVMIDIESSKGEKVFIEI
jgi:hypothetical protein